MFHCLTGTAGKCYDNREEYTEVLHCKRFHTDQSGPWFMISDAMSGSKCGESAVFNERIKGDSLRSFIFGVISFQGEFKLENARLKPEYLTNYMEHDKEHTRHRMQMLFLKKSKTEEEDIVRGCINVEFDIIF